MTTKGEGIHWHQVGTYVASYNSNRAIARFRDRKKQRENALETIVERLKSQSEVLEGEASNLRKENSEGVLNSDTLLLTDMHRLAIEFARIG